MSANEIAFFCIYAVGWFWAYFEGMDAAYGMPEFHAEPATNVMLIVLSVVAGFLWPLLILGRLALPVFDAILGRHWTDP